MTINRQKKQKQNTTINLTFYFYFDFIKCNVTNIAVPLLPLECTIRLNAESLKEYDAGSPLDAGRNADSDQRT